MLTPSPWVRNLALLIPCEWQGILELLHVALVDMVLARKRFSASSRVTPHPLMVKRLSCKCDPFMFLLIISRRILAKEITSACGRKVGAGQVLLHTSYVPMASAYNQMQCCYVLLAQALPPAVGPRNFIGLWISFVVKETT